MFFFLRCYNNQIFADPYCFCGGPGERVNLSHGSSVLTCVWYDRVKEDILLSQTTSVAKAVRKEANMRGWQGHVKEPCSSYKSQWSDREAVTSHDPLLPLKNPGYPTNATCKNICVYVSEYLSISVNSDRLAAVFNCEMRADVL